MADDAFEKFNELADRVQPLQDKLQAAWASFNVDPTMANFDEFEAVRSAVNADLDAILPEIADITPNSVVTLRMVFYHRADVNSIFGDQNPADFLRCVGKYKSFNTKFWRSQGWKGY